MLVDPHVAGKVAARELGQIEAIMQDRPEHAIGEAVVVFLVVLGVQTGRHELDVVVVDCRGLERIAFARDLAAPAEPHARPFAKRRLDGHFEAAGAPAALAIRDGDAIGNNYEPRQYRSSQLFDSRSALRITPAIE